MHPTAPFVKRQGEVNAWDNPDFRQAVEATGRKQIIIAGITTDVSGWSSILAVVFVNLIASAAKVCIAFLALSLRDAGYSVWHNTDASGMFGFTT